MIRPDVLERALEARDRGLDQPLLPFGNRGEHVTARARKSATIRDTLESFTDEMLTQGGPAFLNQKWRNQAPEAAQDLSSSEQSGLNLFSNGLPELPLDCGKLLYDSMTERDRNQKFTVIGQPPSASMICSH